MPADNQTQARLDLHRYAENRRNCPPNHLVPHIGRHVAWNPDGTRILASGDDLEELVGRLQGLNISPSEVVFDFIDPPDEAVLE